MDEYPTTSCNPHMLLVVPTHHDNILHKGVPLLCLDDGEDVDGLFDDYTWQWGGPFIFLDFTDDSDVIVVFDEETHEVKEGLRSRFYVRLDHEAGRAAAARALAYKLCPEFHGGYSAHYEWSLQRNSGVLYCGDSFARRYMHYTSPVIASTYRRLDSTMADGYSTFDAVILQRWLESA